MIARRLPPLVRLVAAAAFAVVASAPSSVRADDAARTYPVALKPSWKAGDAVTITGTEHKVTAVAKVVDGKEVPDPQIGSREDRTTEYEAVLRCEAASSDGTPTKSLLHFVKWTSTADGATDASAKGVTFRLEGTGDAKTTTVVSTGAAPSEKAVAWVEESFGKGSRTDAILVALSPKDPQAVGATWAVEGATILPALGTEVPIDVDGTKAELSVVSVKGDEMEVHVAMVVALKGLPAGPGVVLPWKDGGKDTTAVKHVKAVGPSLASTTESEEEMDGIADAGEFEVHMAIKQTQSQTVRPGGTIPATK